MSEVAGSVVGCVPTASALRATVLFGYYGLVREGRRGEAIGSTEVLGWLARHYPEDPSPSDSLVQKVLHEEKLPHRRPGRPRAESVASVDAPPLCPLRAKPPRSRERK